MRKRLFVTSTGTDIGKTFVTAALVRQAKGLDKSVDALKPVVSGFDADKPENSDSGVLLSSLGRMLTAESIERISPWRYALPLAPTLAAQAEERECVDFDRLVAHSRASIEGPENVVLIEGVGGAMVPLNAKHTVIDWMEALGIPAILVTGSYLGAISHALTTLEVLKMRRIPVHAVVLNESHRSTVSMQAVVNELAPRVRAPLVCVARRSAPDGWKDVPELKGLLAA